MHNSILFNYSNNYLFQDFENLSNYFKIMHTNIQSLNKKAALLEGYLLQLQFQFDIIILTETWNLDSNLYQNFLDGYTFLHFKNSSLKSAGVGCFIKSSCIYDSQTVTYISDSDVGLVNIKLHNNELLSIYCIYRHPNSKNIPNFLTDISNIHFNPRNINIIIGDINIDLLNTKNKHTKEYVDILSNKYFFNLNKDLKKKIN